MEIFGKRKIVTRIIICLVGFFLLLGAYEIGEFVGSKEAEYSSHWGEQYQRNFFGPQSGQNQVFAPSNLLHAHGVVGLILNVQDNQISVQGQDAEKIVLVTNKTVIRLGRELIHVSDLNAGIRIGVIGEPNANGQIEAQMIRVMP